MTNEPRKRSNKANDAGRSNEGRFKPGHSGNLAGRPKKKPPAKAPSFNPVRMPTRSLLRHEAARNIQIRDTNGVSDVPSRKQSCGL
jgi:hypothetical protein